MNKETVKQFFKSIWDFAKQYPGTFFVLVVFLIFTINTIGTFFDGNSPTKYCLFVAIPFCIYSIVIYCWQRFMKNKNKLSCVWLLKIVKKQHNVE